MKDIKYKNPSSSFAKLSASNSENVGGRSSYNITNSICEYYMISLDSLKTYSKQSRKVFSDEDIKSLAESIKNYGVRQPLSVIRCQNEPGTFEIVSGERRAKAAKIAGLDKVPCIIINDSQNAEAIAVIENIQRKDLHPVELARAYEFLRENGSFKDLKDMWNTIGVNETSGYEILNILKLSSEIQEELLNCSITRQQIRSLIKSKNPEIYVEGILHGRVNKTKSVVRITTNNGEFSIQKSAIKKLSDVDRKKLKAVLEDLIKAL